MTDNPAMQRRIGVEIETAGVDIVDVANAVQSVFPGRQKRNHALEYVVQADEGTFRVELDSRPLKSLAERAAADDEEFSLSRLGLRAIQGVAETLVPCEIVTPPLPESSLTRLDSLVVQLRELGARGTHDGLLYAFGLHFNPELDDISAAVIRDHLRAFFLLRPWTKLRFDTDLSRELSLFIRPHADEYVQLVLHDDYSPSMNQLIDDYLAANPSRNYDLDMLPMFAHVDAERVYRALKEGEKVNPRPTFHYRLPNADVSDPGWSVSREWQSWRAVERLAADTERLTRTRRIWNQRHADGSFDEEQWICDMDVLMS